MPVFYPYLIGHAPVLISVPGALIALALAWLAWRSTRRLGAPLRRLGLAAAAYLALFGGFMLFGRACDSSRERWVAWHRQGAGLKPGLTFAEVQAHLRSHASAVQCDEGACTYAPDGLGRYAFSIFDLYGVELKFGPDGRLASSRTWAD